jgi:hypothetical protein
LTVETKYIDFSTLRHAYAVVKTFLEEDSFQKIKSLNVRVEEDLGMVGLDNIILLEEFISKFELDYKDFNYDKYFYPEVEKPEIILARFLSLPIVLPLRTIELLMFNKIKFHFNIDKKQDLSFRDLITWYIEKGFKEPGSVKYKIKHTL